MTWRKRPHPATTARKAAEATRSRIRAQADLERTKDETPAYAALAESLRELRERNHFADALRATITGRAN